MKKLNLLLIVILLFQLSCKKNHTENVQTLNLEETRYRMYDSVILVSNGGGIIQEDHYVLNKDIKIYKTITSGELIYNSDTFVIFQNVPPSYNMKNGSFPILTFKNDSLSISRHLGGVGIQTWEYLECVKY